MSFAAAYGYGYISPLWVQPPASSGSETGASAPTPEQRLTHAATLISTLETKAKLPEQNGTLTQAELQEAMSTLSSNPSMTNGDSRSGAYLRDHFAAADTTHDGVLGQYEIANALQNMEADYTA